MNLNEMSLTELSFNEISDISGGGEFFKLFGRFLGAWANNVNNYSSDGSNPLVLMGGA